MKRIIWIIECCIFCISIYQVRAENIDDIQDKARILIESGQMGEAIKLHEQVVAADSANYESNLWLGNYFFLQGRDLVNAEDTKFGAIKDPTKMQTALHMDELKSIYNKSFIIAEPFLKKAFEYNRNEYLQKLIDSVESFRIRIGIKALQDRKTRKK